MREQLSRESVSVENAGRDAKLRKELATGAAGAAVGLRWEARSPGAGALQTAESSSQDGLFHA